MPGLSEENTYQGEYKTEVRISKSFVNETEMRPKKCADYKLLTIGLDQKDKEYLDKQRGKVTRGDYLTMGMYSMDKDVSDSLKSYVEKIKQLSDENHGLKKQLLFLQSKNSNNGTLDNEIKQARKSYYIERAEGLFDQWFNKKLEPNWDNMVSKRPDLGFKNGKDLKMWIFSEFKKNKLI